MPQQYRPRTVTIPAGGHYSGRLDLRGYLYIEKLELPAGWTAAALTFQQRVSGTWRDVYDDAGELTVAAAGGAIPLILDKLVGNGVFRLRSGTAAAPVNQVAGRAIIAHVRRV